MGNIENKNIYYNYKNFYNYKYNFLKEIELETLKKYQLKEEILEIINEKHVNKNNKNKLKNILMIECYNEKENKIDIDKFYNKCKEINLSNRNCI